MILGFSSEHIVSRNAFDSKSLYSVANSGLAGAMQHDDLGAVLQYCLQILFWYLALDRVLGTWLIVALLVQCQFIICLFYFLIYFLVRISLE